MTQFIGSRDVFIRTFCALVGGWHSDGEKPNQRYIYEYIYTRKKSLQWNRGLTIKQLHEVSYLISQRKIRGDKPRNFNRFNILEFLSKSGWDRSDEFYMRNFSKRSLSSGAFRLLWASEIYIGEKRASVVQVCRVMDILKLKCSWVKRHGNVQ